MNDSMVGLQVGWSNEPTLADPDYEGGYRATMSLVLNKSVITNLYTHNADGSQNGNFKMNGYYATDPRGNLAVIHIYPLNEGELMATWSGLPEELRTAIDAVSWNSGHKSLQYLRKFVPYMASNAVRDFLNEMTAKLAGAVAQDANVHDAETTAKLAAIGVTAKRSVELILTDEWYTPFKSSYRQMQSKRFVLTTSYVSNLRLALHNASDYPGIPSGGLIPIYHDDDNNHPLGQPAWFESFNYQDQVPGAGQAAIVLETVRAIAEGMV